MNNYTSVYEIPIEKRGDIIMERIQLPDGRFVDTIKEIIGGPYIIIDLDLLMGHDAWIASDKKRVTICGTKFEIVGEDPERGALIVCKKKYAANAKRMFRIKRFWRIMESRIIATFDIWGLAYTPHGCYPQWRDIGKKRP